MQNKWLKKKKKKKKEMDTDLHSGQDQEGGNPFLNSPTSEDTVSTRTDIVSRPGQQVHCQDRSLTLHTRWQALVNRSVISNEDRCLDGTFSIGLSSSVIPPSSSLHPMI